MTRDEMFERGLVPTADVAPLLRRGLICDFGQDFYVEGAGSLPRILAKWEKSQGHAEFNSVDSALAKVNMVHAWREEAPESYYRPNLTGHSRPGGAKRCARIGCSNEIVNAPNKTGGKPKKYCSKRCRDASHRHRTGKQVPRQFGKCVHGHERSPENTRITKGSRGLPVKQCRVCAKENKRKRRFVRANG